VYKPGPWVLYKIVTWRCIQFSHKECTKEWHVKSPRHKNALLQELPLLEGWWSINWSWNALYTLHCHVGDCSCHFRLCKSVLSCQLLASQSRLVSCQLLASLSFVSCQWVVSWPSFFCCQVASYCRSQLNPACLEYFAIDTAPNKKEKNTKLWKHFVFPINEHGQAITIKGGPSRLQTDYTS